MATSVASVVSHFPEAENGFTTTTAGSVSSGAATVTLNSVAGYTNGQPVVLVIDPTDATKKQTFTGIVDTAGVQITNVVWTAGTNQTHALGATVVDYATATHISMISKGILVDDSQAGAHEIATNYDPSNPTLETQKWAGLASAVNEITVTNATTGNFPTISATGEADTGIDFENSEGEEILKLDAVASAVNEITITNAVTTASPQVSATGGDSNIDVRIVPKGTGNVKRGATGGSIDWWEEIGRTTLSGAGDTISVTSLPARKYLRVLVLAMATGGTINAQLQFNGDTGANYSARSSANGGADGTGVSSTAAGLSASASATTRIIELTVLNVLAQEKLMTGHCVEGGTAGAGNVTSRSELANKWANTAAQISRVDIINAGTGDFAIGSECIVLGHD